MLLLSISRQYSPKMNSREFSSAVVSCDNLFDLQCTCMTYAAKTLAVGIDFTHSVFQQ